MSVATNAGNTPDSEVKGFHRETGFPKEGHYEAAQTAVDMQADLVLVCKLAESYNVILAPIGEVDCRANELL